ncbi:hypothetical protein [Paucisalibacillus globulus]|uniref:hypothetical protein n=1 Tax=Paucisalibacillus globulus TaxID=351095 RepID=UPI001FE212DB|nr:hypothetical protein [Paucisalibacillus globulus]
MIIVIIEMDGYFHQVLLIGKKCTKQQLRQKYLLVKELTNQINDLPNLFCRLYNFEKIPFDCDLIVDFVIDTDTDRIYSPTY